MAHDRTIALSILEALAFEHDEISALGAGLASEAWLIRDGGTPLVLRIASYPDDPVTYLSEHAVMTSLGASGASVPVPVTGSWLLADWHGPAFSITSFLPGTPLASEAFAWADKPIAAFLRLLHGLPVSGHGPVIEIDGRLRGRQQDAESGAIDAWSGAPLWPLGGASLDRHPAIGLLPRLARAMARHRTAVRAAILGGPAALIHGDLHEENILQDGRSLGFIDFGIAFVGAPAWEFAALAYFLGWGLSDRTLTRYLDGPDDLDRWRSTIALVALSLGARRWEQDRDNELHEDIHNETFILEALDRLP